MKFLFISSWSSYFISAGCQLGQWILTGLCQSVAQRCWLQSVSPSVWSSLPQGILYKYIQQLRNPGITSYFPFFSVILIKIQKLELLSMSSVISIPWDGPPYCSTPACLCHFTLCHISILGTSSRHHTIAHHTTPRHCLQAGGSGGGGGSCLDVGWQAAGGAWAGSTLWSWGSWSWWSWHWRFHPDHLEGPREAEQSISLHLRGRGDLSAPPGLL